MSLLKPSIPQFSPFDATKDYTLNFLIDSSSDQCFGNRIIIKNNSTNVTVYDNITTSFLLQHLILKNTLQNGIIYKITVAYFNLSGTYSSFSDGTIFKCLATPVVSISNITSQEVIASNTFTPQGSFSQVNGDTLSTYEYYLYDGNGVLLQSSPTLFYLPNLVCEYTFTNLTNDEKYGLSLHTMSTNGVEVDTDVVYFTVSYIAPTFSGVLDLINLPEKGAVEVQSDAIQIIGKVTGTFNYQNGEWIDLTEGVLSFNNTQGMAVFSNFSLKIFVKNIQIDKPFLILSSPQGNIKLCWESWNHCINATKTLVSGINEYNIFQQVINPTTENTVVIFLQQINNYMNIQYEILS